MIGRYLWIANLSIVVVFSYLLADLLNLFIGRNLELNPSLPPASSISGRPAVVRPAAELSSVILDRNIFSLKPVAAISPEFAQEQAPVSLPPLRIRLIGTVLDDGALSFAIVEDLSTRQQTLHRTGEPIAEDGVLAEVGRNQIVVQRGSVRETVEVLLTEEGQIASSAPQPMAVPASLPAPANVGARVVLDKQEVQAALENLPQLLTKARVVPFMTPEGKSDGFRIVSIAPASFYERIGLQNGDILQRINGIEIKDPETFMRVFSQLREESEIALDLIRRNQKSTLNYEIR